MFDSPIDQFWRTLANGSGPVLLDPIFLNPKPTRSPSEPRTKEHVHDQHLNAQRRIKCRADLCVGLLVPVLVGPAPLPSLHTSVDGEYQC
jgi:hypothetical protein